ncbi:MAG: acetyl-CoA carboxylase biotin carboxyl carrier protein [Lachnospiraceae bacterium]
MTIDEIVTLIQAVSENGLTSFAYEEGNQKLVLKKKEKVCVVKAAGHEIPAAAVQVAESIHNAGAEPLTTENAATFNSDKVILSPLVGTFYSASCPEDEPFVKVGDTVKKGQVLGIIEAMKLMNEIESEYDGIIEAVLVNNEEVVEFGQPLFRIK